jgi:hypothetical protein
VEGFWVGETEGLTQFKELEKDSALKRKIIEK